MEEPFVKEVFTARSDVPNRQKSNSIFFLPSCLPWFDLSIVQLRDTPFSDDLMIHPAVQDHITHLYCSSFGISLPKEQQCLACPGTLSQWERDPRNWNSPPLCSGWTGIITAEDQSHVTALFAVRDCIVCCALGTKVLENGTNGSLKCRIKQEALYSGECVVSGF